MNVESPTQLSIATNGTGAPVLSAAQATSVERAVAEYSNKQGVTAEEIETFTGEITKRVLANSRREAIEAGRAARKARKDRFLAGSKALKVRFTTLRNTELTTVPHHDVVEAAKGVRVLQQRSSGQGGVTVCFSYGFDENHNLAFVYSVAVCRDDENFDSLFGREKAFERFISGQNLSVPFEHSDLEAEGLTTKNILALIKQWVKTYIAGPSEKAEDGEVELQTHQGTLIHASPATVDAIAAQYPELHEAPVVEVIDTPAPATTLAAEPEPA